MPLRVKGFLAFAAVVAYSMFLAAFILYEKASLLNEFTRLQEIHEVEGQLRQVEQAAFHAITAVYINAGAADQNAGLRRIQAHFDVLEKRNAELTKRFPFAGASLTEPQRAMARAAADPSEAELTALRVELLKTKNELAQQVEHYRQTQTAMAGRFRAQCDSVAITSVLLGLFGIGLLGAIIGLFFTRLTNDLLTLKTRALEIVKGERSQAIPVSRNDEVGELMLAVNHMAGALDEREKELVIARQRYFHQEKMAAVGALAAGVAHEIGNPIAAMSGVVQEMVDKQNAHECVVVGRVCNPAMLQAQIQRLSAITREISGFAAPQPAERHLLDLNGLVRTAGGLMGYDKRMRRVNLRLKLDDQLPAIYGVADQLTQVIMNLLINAADALESVEDRPREITLYSEVSGGNACLTVMDNGCGMDRGTLNRTFEAFFTTKSKGTGLGLSLCYSIVTGHGGTIEIDSDPGVGTRVQVFLPLPVDDEAETP
ncbi:MAG: HAMP domain-containing protein [Hydrogenophilales bacterium]|nr:HAMP domain-containing protein [Hydrogenophilales bacterium]